MNVLLVEDYDDLRELIARHLRRRGHQVAESRNAAEALALPDLQTIQMAILDYRLPDVNGIDLGRRLRERSPAMRIVLCSASDPGEFEGAAELAEAGFDYVDKAKLPPALEALMS